MHESLNVAGAVVAAANEIAARYGASMRADQRREIVRLARAWMRDGMTLREAAEGATTIVLGLHAIEDSPRR